MRSFLFFALFVACFLLSIQSEAVNYLPPDCSTATSCDECLSLGPQCGFCIVSNVGACVDTYTRDEIGGTVTMNDGACDRWLFDTNCPAPDIIAADSELFNLDNFRPARIGEIEFNSINETVETAWATFKDAILLARSMNDTTLLQSLVAEIRTSLDNGYLQGNITEFVNNMTASLENVIAEFTAFQAQFETFRTEVELALQDRNHTALVIALRAQYILANARMRIIIFSLRIRHSIRVLQAQIAVIVGKILTVQYLVDSLTYSRDATLAATDAANVDLLINLVRRRMLLLALTQAMEQHWVQMVSREANALAFAVENFKDFEDRIYRARLDRIRGLLRNDTIRAFVGHILRNTFEGLLDFNISVNADVSPPNVRFFIRLREALAALDESILATLKQRILRLIRLIVTVHFGAENDTTTVTIDSVENVENGTVAKRALGSAATFVVSSDLGGSSASSIVASVMLVIVGLVAALI